MAAGQTSQKGRLKILVVDDDPTLLRMVERMLKPLGEVLLARDGEEGLSLAKAEMPDVVVTDLMMPRMDGLTLAARLKDEPGLGKVPVIMLTAKGRPADVIAGINAGARSYITKPFKQDELIGKVKKALQL